jgi:hypothetical protein
MDTEARMLPPMTNSTTADDIRTRPTSGTAARRALAAAMVTAPLLLLAETAILPAALDERHGADRAKSLHVLTAAAPDRALLPVSILLVGLGLGLLTAAGFGLAWLAGGRPSAVVGAAMITVGAPMGAATNAISAMTLYRLTDPALARSSAVDVLAYQQGPAGFTLFFLYLLVLLGMLVLSVALVRSRALRWWQALLIGPATLLSFFGAGGLLGAILTLPMVLGLTLAARQLLRADA